MKSPVAELRFSWTNTWCKQLLIIIYALLLGVCMFRGNSYAQTINREMASKILKALNVSGPDTSRIRMLADLAKYNLFKPGEQKDDLDSATYFLGKAKYLSDSLHTMEWQHECESISTIILMERGQSNAGRVQFSKLIQEFKHTKDAEAEATLRLRFGVWLGTTGNDDAEALDNYSKAAAIYRRLHEPLNENPVLMRIASKHYNEGKIDLADQEYQQILKNYKAIGYPKLQYIYNWLATISRVKGNLNNGLKYEMLCIQSMQRDHDTVAAARFYGDFARMYVEVGNNAKAVEWYTRAIRSFIHEAEPQFPMYVAAGYIAADKIARGRPEEALKFNQSLVTRLPPITVLQKACVAQNLAICYDALHQPGVAEKYYLQSIELYQQSGGSFEVSQEAWQAIGKFYLEQRSYKKAAYYLNHTLSVRPQTLSIIGIKDVQFMLFKIDSAQRDYLSAIDHFKQSKLLDDSIFNARKVREIEELQIRYESDKKDRDIAAQARNIDLLRKVSQLQDSKLKQNLLKQKLLMGGGLMLLVIIGLGYNRYRLKQASTRVLQQKQQEISAQNEVLQKLLSEKNSLLNDQSKLLSDKEHLITEKNLLLSEVHHRVKNNLHLILSLLESQAAFLEKGEVLQAIKNSQHRINAISLIHQRLYITENLTAIRLDEYLQELVNCLGESFGIEQNIVFELLLDKVIIDVSKAVPIGIIVNEVITNAIKYAFPIEKKGLIKMKLTENAGNRVSFSIEDNGIGLPEGFDLTAGKSLGLKLIRGLCAELHATLMIGDKSGLKFNIEFHK